MFNYWCLSHFAAPKPNIRLYCDVLHITAYFVQCYLLVADLGATTHVWFVP